MTKQFTPDLKLKSVNYYHKIQNYVKVCEIFRARQYLIAIMLLCKQYKGYWII